MSIPTPPQIQIRPRTADQSATFYWSAPISDGGSAILGYRLSDGYGATQSVDAETFIYTWTGLTNGIDYAFSIAAEVSN